VALQVFCVFLADASGWNQRRQITQRRSGDACILRLSVGAEAAGHWLATALVGHDPAAPHGGLRPSVDHHPPA